MFAALHVADFALHAVLRTWPDAGKIPAALVRDEALIVACTADARALGVEPGQAAPQALARCPRLRVLNPHAAAETEAAASLLAAAFAISPCVEATAPGLCTLLVDGLPAERRELSVQRALDHLAQLGLPATGGIGSTPLLALYAARHAGGNVGVSRSRRGNEAGPNHSHPGHVAAEVTRLGSTPPDSNQPPHVGCYPESASCAGADNGSSLLALHDERAFLEHLPLAVADPPADLADILAGWGLRTFGDLTALPKAAIAQRLGPAGVALWERAAGETTRPLQLVRPPRVFSAAMTCEFELETLEPLLFLLRRFVDRLALELATAALAAAELTLTLILADEKKAAHTLRLAEPSTDADTLFRTLQTYLETVRTDAAVVGIALELTPTRAAIRQHGLFDRALRDPHRFAESLARVAALVGSDRVGTPVLADTHRPDAFTLTAPAIEIPARKSDPVHPPQGLVLRRYRPPQPVTVLSIGSPPRPAHVRAGLPARESVVHAAHGPWRAAGDWWQADRAWQREEWDVELDGLYRLLRTPEGWFLEGEYD